MVNGLTFLVLLDVVEAKGKDFEDDLNKDCLPVFVLIYRTRCGFLHDLIVLLAIWRLVFFRSQQRRGCSRGSVPAEYLYAPVFPFVPELD